MMVSLTNRQKVFTQLGIVDDGIQYAEIAWYIEILITIGAWFSALALTVPVIAIFGLSSDSAKELLVPAVVVVVAAFFILRQSTIGPFLRQFAATLALAGEGLFVIVMGDLTHSLEIAATAAVVLTLVSLSFLPQVSIQFPATVATMGLIILAIVFDSDSVWLVDFTLAFSMAFGVYLLLQPPRRFDVRGFATALVLIAPIVLGFGELGLARELGEYTWYPGWAAQSVLVLIALWLVWRLRLFIHDRRMQLLLAAAVILLGAIIPAGLYSAVVLLLIAYSLGSMPWAVISGLAVCYAVTRLYYMLGISLLLKSFLLAGAGLICIGLWFFAERAARVGEKL
ncbi:MAG: DUF4401 domain-containing protein [Alphaproteobacteria bacterium]